MSKEVNTVIQVLNPRRKRLQREEALLLPALGHKVVEDGISHLLKLLTHDNLSLKGLLHVDEADLHVS